MSSSALQEFIRRIPAAERPPNGEALARRIVKEGMLTRYQADAVLEREFSRLSIGQYELLEQVGAGGMGTVYKARHRRMNRIVAVKLIRRRHEDLADAARRFEREVHVISGLQHPNIVVAHDADECDAGPFLVMEFVWGRDLESIVRHGGALSAAAAVDYTLQSARGLAYAHGRGVVHRDIKPANLLRVDETGCIKITDLGLARLKDDSAPGGERVSSLTATGNILGTVLFMAPEQAIDSKASDHRCDVYSLGCTLFYLLHGRPPFVGESTIDTVMQHRNAPIPSLRESRPDVPESVDRVFQRMVAKSPDDRFSTMDDVATALNACQADPELPAPAASVPAFPPAVSVAHTTAYQGDQPTTIEASVLLAEPSNAQAVLIRTFLETHGVNQVRRCRTGHEALHSWAESKADAVIAAMHLDDMTGLELVRQLSADARHGSTVFILISSSLDATNLEHAARALGVTLLAKPFDDKQLARALREAVAARPKSQ
jgi:eukaryotic-like serine/threonine-protein kinase